MYDYLGGEQVKLFYNAILDESDGNVEKMGTWHSGGELRYFGKDDDLPLTTLYYKYPLDFMIMDFRWDDNVHIISNGKFKKTININHILDKDFINKVYDNYGRELNITSLEKLKLIKNEWEIALKKDKAIELSLFPQGLLSTIRNNLEYFISKEDEWNKIRYQGTNKFYKKWYIEDEFYEEKNFGEALDVYLFFEMARENSIAESTILSDYYINGNEKSKLYLVYLYEKDSTIIKRYVEWLSNNEITEDDLNSIIVGIKEETK